MTTSSSFRLNVDLEPLPSTADCILYTYGVGDSQPQAIPNYILELARREPLKTFELIHCDPVFSTARAQFPACLREHEWTRLPSTENYRFKHKECSNLSVKLVPTGFSASSTFDVKFEKLVETQLKQGAEIFLGVHNACWTDMQSCMGETYNKLRERYPKIHFYIQAGDIPAFVYKGPYHPILGLFAQAMCHHNSSVWVTFQRVFSRSNPSQKDVENVKRAFKRFVDIRSNPNLDRKVAKVFESAIDREQLALGCSKEALYDYLNKPLKHRLIVIPIQLLTAEMWFTDPGQELFPSNIPLHHERRPYEPYFTALSCGTCAVAIIALLSRMWTETNSLEQA